MIKYTVILSGKVSKQLDKLSDTVAAPIFKAIRKLQQNPRPPGYCKLTARDGYRIRVGDYRIIYNIIDSKLIIEVIAIGHRKDIYQ
ncbi:type II toxin-antitoxin system RelE family toxin [Niabella drilacis]|uniref:mRNA interferase RelE/StbE n=1 Tax=Niabella drilacis (strain DSM 25811 / CCM 8410 / CCUG 62505 / LMG 26954 / E90) TaxID=1285928 RepID=A0A1G6Z6D8_NIADE|nr:type II toxin-antitoxin system RelE/ParE family toxin [Niabella drilacis]SDD97435.1 mRNA interferase RelE/StbE [Niabella drilacis]